MNGKEFISASEAMTKYIVNYAENIRDRRVLPDVEPGYIRDLLPNHLPEEPQKFEAIMEDIEKIIMPGVTHWHSPRFHAYFPTASSYPSILADMLCGAIGCIGFSWISSPACTELEVVMLDWLGELIGLPKEFLAKNGTNGGGVIQGSASDATLVTLLSAKQKKLNSLVSGKKSEVPVSSLIAYASDESHCSVERAAMLGGVKIRLLPSDEKQSLKGEVLRKAIQEDLQKGLIPFYVVATIGTTNCCSFDDLKELGEVCKDFNLWIHVDAAYAGSAFVCEEYRYLMEGVELVDSFNFNPHKWLLVNFDCSAMWIKNSNDLVSAFSVDPVYLQHEFQGKVPDYRHWQIPLGRRFRSLKLWFVMRIYGKSGLQKYIRKHIRLAKEFENFVRNDSRFEIFYEVLLGLVCFRLKGTNELNEKLLHVINHGGIIHLVPGTVKGIYFLRFAICSQYTESHDVALSWDVVKKAATDLLKNEIEN